MKTFEVQLSKTYKIQAEDDGVAGEIARRYFEEDIVKTFCPDFELRIIGLGMETSITEMKQ